MSFNFSNLRRQGRLGAGLLLALGLGLAACTDKPSAFVPPVAPPIVPAVNETARDYNDYTTVVWSDEFTGGALDQSKWGYDLGGGGWGNNELQAYTNSNDNVDLAGGNLVIQARRQ